MTVISSHYSKKSKITRTLWMGMAVFFLLFCSSPVKKYIRLHLYNQKFVVENTKGDHFSTYDIKDCLIADRHQQSEISILSVIHGPSDDLQQDFAFFLPSFIPNKAIAFFRKEERQHTATLPDGIAMPVPVYLWVRHLQV